MARRIARLGHDAASRVAIVAVVAAIAAMPRAARAEGGVDLAWTAPAGCPDTRDVEARVARLREGAAAPPRPLRARGVVDRTAGGWRMDLSLTTDAATSERTVEAATCEELADAAALLVALATDAEAARAPEPGARVPRPPAAADAAAADRPAAMRAARAPEDGPVTRLGVRLLASAEIGSLPAPGLGLGDVAALDVGAVRAEVGAVHVLPREGRVPGASAGADVSLTTAVARGCWVPRRPWLEAGGCAGLEAGTLQAAGFGVSDPGEGSSPWVAPQLAVLAALEPVRAVRLVMTAEAAVPMARERFVLVGVGDVHQASAVSGRVSLGLELRP